MVIDNINNKEFSIAGRYLLRQGLFYPEILVRECRTLQNNLKAQAKRMR
jgi:hypothetical protein